MSPLTPTPPQTQTPLITPGSFATQPLIAEVATQIHGLLSDEKQKEITDGISQREQQKSHLITLLEELKLSQKGYDFSDYEERLLLSEEEIEELLEKKVFTKPKKPISIRERLIAIIDPSKVRESTEIGTIFYSYLHAVTHSSAPEKITRMKQKLMREFGLYDLVYESRNLSYDKKQYFVIGSNINETEQVLVRIQKLDLNKIRAIDMYVNFFGDDDYALIFKTANQVGIRAIDMGDPIQSDRPITNFNYAKILSEIGNGNIRSLSCGRGSIRCNLHMEGLIEIVKEVGKTGIKSLIFGGGDFSRIIDFEDMKEFLRAVGIARIKSLTLSYNASFYAYSYEQILELVQIAGESGLRRFKADIHSINLSSHQKLEIIEIAKQYNLHIYQVID